MHPMFQKLMGLLVAALSLCAEAKRPEWIERPYEKECQKRHELCAVGEGQGLLAAELSGRAALARFFQTQVDSQTTQTTETSSIESLDVGLRADFEEKIQQQVRQKTDYVLEGAELRESYNGEQSVFALVSLDKKLAAKTYAEQMEALDTENKDLYQKKTRSSLLQLEQNIKTREELHKSYRLLTQKPYPAAVSLEQVLKLKAKLQEQEVTLFLDFEQDVPDVIQHELVSVLMAQGYRGLKKELKDYDYRVHVEYEAQKRYLNVKGFEKYSITLNMSSFSPENEQLGQLNLSQTQVGRNKLQALEKTLTDSKKQIREKIYQLKLD